MDRAQHGGTSRIIHLEDISLRKWLRKGLPVTFPANTGRMRQGGEKTRCDDTPAQRKSRNPFGLRLCSFGAEGEILAANGSSPMNYLEKLAPAVLNRHTG